MATTFVITSSCDPSPPYSQFQTLSKAPTPNASTPACSLSSLPTLVLSPCYTHPNALSVPATALFALQGRAVSGCATALPALAFTRITRHHRFSTTVDQCSFKLMTIAVTVP